MTEDTYSCNMCHGVFEKEWSDEEAMKEYEANFPSKEPEYEDPVLVCDNCYSMIMEKKK